MAPDRPSKARRRTAPPPAAADRPPPRVVVRHESPLVDGGRHPVKRVVGEPVDVVAVAYADGHDHLHLVVLADGDVAPVTPMAPADPGLDRWAGRVPPLPRGRHELRVVAWVDEVASWFDATRRKVEAEVPVASELEEGAALLRSAIATAARGVGARTPDHDAAATAAVLERAAARLDAGDTAVVTRDADADAVVAAARACLVVDDAAAAEAVTVLVERELALFSSWYELFPRSWGPEPGVHGTLADVRGALDEVAAMGFDIVYLPPVHPIGTSHRKGPDNSETAGPGDPGSPWAIGSPEGGHTAVHPELGTVDDVADLAAACRELGMELALDVALQCSPDHPWVTEHPDWFRHRPDGTIHYAENPPKKYQDIYPLDFGCADWQALWAACRDVFLFWAERGVSVFRVDNPHTKPFPFWAWCLAEVRDRHPDAVFLSEAFTRPEPMHGLAALGFTQSYGYFPWRVGKDELLDHLVEVSRPPSVDRLRPSWWPNTPDILPWHLQGASREQFALRVALAATMSPSYGIYGPAFELCENVPAGNGKEEYARSEKYELRWWDRDDPRSLRGLVASLNRIRRDQLALHTLRTVVVHGVDDDALLAFSKTAHGGPSVDPSRPAEATVLVVANLHDAEVRAGTCSLDLAALGVDPARPYLAHDLVGGETWTWEGAHPYVELHPDRAPLHILRITQP